VFCGLFGNRDRVGIVAAYRTSRMVQVRHDHAKGKLSFSLLEKYLDVAIGVVLFG